MQPVQPLQVLLPADSEGLRLHGARLQKLRNFSTLSAIGPSLLVPEG